jgi:hypothetical protein
MRETVMNSPILLTEDEFDQRYPLRVNHLDPNASWAVGEGPGCLFETYGEELEFVRRQNPRTVFTLVEGDTGGLLVISGMHLVNRIGYLVSALPVPDDQYIEVHLETPTEPEGEDL